MSAVGVVLAGGRGRRMGGDKAVALLRGVPLVHHSLRALAAATDTQAVVVKAATALPPLPPGVARWEEPDEPQHPLTGVLHALRQAGGAPVLCLAVDLPLLDGATLRALLEAPAAGRPCVVAAAGGRLQPLCALWRASALEALLRLPADLAMRDVVASLDPVVVPVGDARQFTNVNRPADLLRLERP